MDRLLPAETEAQKSLLAVLMGFFGVTAAIYLLPRTVKFLLRRFLFGLMAEIVTVVVTGLLTEKVVDWVSHDAAMGDGHAGAPTTTRSTAR